MELNIRHFKSWNCMRRLNLVEAHIKCRWFFFQWAKLRSGLVIFNLIFTHCHGKRFILMHKPVCMNSVIFYYVFMYKWQSLLIQYLVCSIIQWRICNTKCLLWPVIYVTVKFTFEYNVCVYHVGLFWTLGSHRCIAWNLGAIIV